MLHGLRRFGAVNYVDSAVGGDGIAKGVSRVALSTEDVAVRAHFAELCSQAGLSPRIDRLGTLLATRPGGRLLCGSHLDSQLEGGWLDGALGCAYALETSSALLEAGIEGVDVVAFSDEEGRFGTLTGSRVFCGGDVDWDAVSLTPSCPKISLAAAAERARPALLATECFLDDILRLEAGRYLGFFEAHIEQGRRLERSEEPCCAVSSIVGLRQLRVTVEGEQNHAGTTLMADRRDAARVLLRFCALVDEAFAQLASTAAPDLVWTFSVLDVHPGMPSAVPGFARCVLQFRDPNAEVLHAACVLVDHVAANENRCRVDVTHDRPPQDPVVFDDTLLAHTQAALKQRQANPTVLHSAAIHDAASLATLGQLPAAMLFVPSIGGVSHAFTEDTREDDILHGALVYTDAAARMLGFQADVRLV